MRRIARQNLCWAAAWNFGSLPLAALGFIPPWAAALGMSLSSILVVMNATRLLPRESDDGRKATATRSAPSLAPSIIVARGVSS
jgi:Cu2+-exporting ATPase